MHVIRDLQQNENVLQALQEENIKSCQNRKQNNIIMQILYKNLTSSSRGARKSCTDILYKLFHEVWNAHPPEYQTKKENIIRKTSKSFV